MSEVQAPPSGATTVPERPLAKPFTRALPELKATPERYHALDALRALAMLLGIVFHALLAYDPHPIGWAVVDLDANRGAASLALVFHSFRLPIFFLIAGFFARLSAERRGVRALVHSRAKRIVLPFLFGWLLLRPLIAFVWIVGESGELGAGDLRRAAAQAAGGFGASLLDPARLFVGTHLWFLYYLALIYAAWLLLRSALLPWTTRALPQVDQALRRVLESRFTVLWLTPPAALAMGGMQRFGIDTPDDSLVPDAPVLVLYGGLFGVGWWLHRQPALLRTLEARWRGWFVTAIALTLPVLAIALARRAGATPWQVVLGRTLYAAMMWAWILGLMGVVSAKLDRPSRSLRYVADASYWLYLAHLPLIVAGQVLWARVGLPWWLEVGANFCVVSGVLLVAYHYCVRSTVIGELLNGRRYAFRRPFAWKP